MATKTKKDPDSEISQDLFSYLQAPQKNAIRAKLLECLPSEQDHSVRNKVGDAVAEIARQYAAESMWL